MQQARQTTARRQLLVGAAGLAGASALAAWGRARWPWAEAGPLRHEAYVWQRAWGPAVQRAVAGAGSDFAALTVLGAEVSWGPAPVVDVRFDGEALRRAGRPVGLAVRVHGLAADPGELQAAVVGAAITRMLRRADEQGVAVGEIQLDFDSPASRLDGYRAWLGRLRPATGGRALTATALPSWLHRPAFAALAGQLDGYVLQVHGLERPVAGRASLFDGAAARRAVALAGALGRPFRLALPTYRYEVAFDAQGRPVGVGAERPASRWDESLDVTPAAARPADVAALVRALHDGRPRALRGLLWYRLPVEGDEHNWAPATLRAVQAGREPRGRLGVRVQADGEGSWSVALTGDGDDEVTADRGVRVSWPDTARRVACDGLGGAQAQVDAGGVTLRPERPFPLRPGQQRVVGWVRLEGDGAPRAALEPTASGVPA